MPATRQRRERFIDDHDSMFAPAFHNALKRCVDRAGGLSWFSDEQIEEIVSEMVATERASHSHMIRERSRHWRRVAAAIDGIRGDLGAIEASEATHLCGHIVSRHRAVAQP